MEGRAVIQYVGLGIILALQPCGNPSQGRRFGRFHAHGAGPTHRSS